MAQELGALAVSFALVHSRAQLGVQAPPVRVEVHVSGGVPRLTIVGLPEAAVRESKDRVRSAIIAAGYHFPRSRITVNLGPADLPKDGGRYDLPIALGILMASQQLPRESTPDETEFVGELALSAELRRVTGTLSAAIAAHAAGRALVVPQPNAAEAALARDATVLWAEHLNHVCHHLMGGVSLSEAEKYEADTGNRRPRLDLAEVREQYRAKRALEVAASGGHSLLMLGPPGTGKSMLAHRLPGILPPLSESHALETAAVHSVSGLGFDPLRWREPPFRAPHHSASAAALVGGGSKPGPGEISLAHNGVLFLDELPEFDRRVIESLREPMETGEVLISRAARQATFPARFQLIAAMNPCACGFAGDPRDLCRCGPGEVERYRTRISGPFLDRIDLQLEVPPPRWLRHGSPKPSPSSIEVRERVSVARKRQFLRAGCLNRERTPKSLERELVAPALELLDAAVEQFTLSPRARDRMMRVARTIADLDGGERVEEHHVGEAMSYRDLDRDLIRQIARRN